jgi:hypothetical protein
LQTARDVTEPRGTAYRPERHQAGGLPLRPGGLGYTDGDEPTQPESRLGRQCHLDPPQCEAAPMSVPQFGLPLDGLDPRADPPRPRGPARATPARPIHVSAFQRAGDDFYATPSWVTEALLRHTRFRGQIWEPCCGDGAMSTVLARHGYTVVSTDIAERGFGTPGVDFLACHTVPEGCRSIVTNPPYGDSGLHAGQSRSPTAMLNFLRHALTLTASVQGQLALLVRLQWIAGQRAAEVMSTAPFAAVVVLTQRILWFDRGEDTKPAQHHHAWVVFDHAHPSGQPPAMLYA